MKLPEVNPDRVLDLIVDNMPSRGYSVAIVLAFATSFWVADKALGAGRKLLGAARNMIHDHTS